MAETFQKFISKSLFRSKITWLLLLVFFIFLAIDSGAIGTIEVLIISSFFLYFLIKNRLLFCILSFSILLFSFHIINPVNLEKSEPHTVCGIVKNIDGSRVELAFTSINDQRATRSVYIKLKPYLVETIHRYYQICFETDRSFQKFQRYAVVLDLTDDDFVLKISNIELAKFIDSSSDYINISLDKYFSSDSGLVKALVFGIKDDLQIEDKKNFQNIGVSHLLVASGANIVIILSVIQVFSRKLKMLTRSPGITLLFEMSVVLLYLLIVGLEGSLVRAVIFWLFLNIEILVGRKIPFVLKLLYCIVTISIIFPENLFSLSFYLSMAALVGINIGDDLVKFLKRSDSPEIIKLFIINFCILITTGIITSYFFAQLNFTGLISNLVMLPLAEFIVGFGFTLSITIFILNILNFEFIDLLLNLFANLLSILIDILRTISQTIEDIGLPEILNSRIYINNQKLLLLIFAIMTFWLFLKFKNYSRIRESTKNI